MLIDCGTSAPTPTAAPNPTATPSPRAHRETVIVDPGAVSSVTITLEALNRVEGEVRVIREQGGLGNDIDFWITDPSNDTTVNPARIREQRSFSFKASTSGNYSLNFGNTFSGANRVVAASLTVFWR